MLPGQLLSLVEVGRTKLPLLLLTDAESVCIGSFV